MSARFSISVGSTCLAAAVWIALAARATVGDEPLLKDPSPTLATDNRLGDGARTLLSENATGRPGVPKRSPAGRFQTTLDPSLIEPKSAPEEPSKPSAEKPSSDEKAGKDEKQQPLTPIPEAVNAGPVEIEITSFHGVTPGVSTREEVEKAWGKPKEVRTQDNLTMHLFSVKPFPHIEVSYLANKVASVIIRFDKGFPAETVAQQLDLLKVQPVLVSNELGEILGQSYPERGVLFSFEPGSEPSKTLKRVTHIILEPITADPFILRAETNLDHRPEFSLHDLDAALKLQPNNARSHWLRSRVLTLLGQYEKAMAASGEAIRLDPREARYLVTRALTMAQAGRVAEAIPQAEKAVELARSHPHVKARALCLLGDLKASTTPPDFKLAFQNHMQAIQVADPLTTSRHPAIRIAAKELLVDAHLGAAHDIAWGEWREKERAIENWIKKASVLADDLVKNEGAGQEYHLRIGTRALAACVGIQGRIDPESWTKQTILAGDSLIAATPDAARKSQLQWEMAMALYDALQIYQMRSDRQSALKYGELAISYLEKSGRQNQSATTSYLLGRLYFRMGAVYAVRGGNHLGAIKWFDKAVPLLGKSPPPEAVASLGRLGETFVSMGISYWETGQREKALALTQHGADLIEDSVKRGTSNSSALTIPYANLASMHRQLGHIDKADRLEEMAAKSKSTKMR